MLISWEQVRTCSYLITSEMNKIEKWLDQNKLSLNIDKTKSMVFGNYKSNNQSRLGLHDITICFV